MAGLGGLIALRIAFKESKAFRFARVTSRVAYFASEKTHMLNAYEFYKISKEFIKYPPNLAGY